MEEEVLQRAAGGGWGLEVGRPSHVVKEVVVVVEHQHGHSGRRQCDGSSEARADQGGKGEGRNFGRPWGLWLPGPEWSPAVAAAAGGVGG